MLNMFNPPVNWYDMIWAGIRVTCFSAKYAHAFPIVWCCYPEAHVSAHVRMRYGSVQGSLLFHTCTFDNKSIVVPRNKRAFFFSHEQDHFGMVWRYHQVHAFLLYLISHKSCFATRMHQIFRSAKVGVTRRVLKWPASNFLMDVGEADKGNLSNQQL